MSLIRILYSITIFVLLGLNLYVSTIHYSEFTIDNQRMQDLYRRAHDSEMDNKELEQEIINIAKERDDLKGQVHDLQLQLSLQIRDHKL